MKRFICLSLYDARKLPGFSEIEETFYCNQYSSSIYETDGKKLIRHVAADGGEPEDQTFGRDLNWIIHELNKLADEAEENFLYSTG